MYMYVQYSASIDNSFRDKQIINKQAVNFKTNKCDRKESKYSRVQLNVQNNKTNVTHSFSRIKMSGTATCMIPTYDIQYIHVYDYLPNA